MNRNIEHTLTSKNVYAFALKTLFQLPLHPKGDKVSVADILNVLLFAAAWRSSITQTCQNLQDTRGLTDRESS